MQIILLLQKLAHLHFMRDRPASSRHLFRYASIIDRYAIIFIDRHYFSLWRMTISDFAAAAADFLYTKSISRNAR